MLQFSFRPCLEGIFASTYPPNNGFYYLPFNNPGALTCIPTTSMHQLPSSHRLSALSTGPVFYKVFSEGDQPCICQHPIRWLNV
jgi:hypothetical protein